jgi:hypothetical protein
MLNPDHRVPKGVCDVVVLSRWGFHMRILEPSLVRYPTKPRIGEEHQNEQVEGDVHISIIGAVFDASGNSTKRESGKAGASMARTGNNAEGDVPPEEKKATSCRRDTRYRVRNFKCIKSRDPLAPRSRDTRMRRNIPYQAFKTIERCW